MSTKKMKAVAKTKRGPGAELIETEVPAIGPNEILVKVNATAICGSDAHVFAWDAFAQEVYKKIPNIMGHELSGDVVEVGQAVDWLEKGDHISAETHINCGHCPTCRQGQIHLCANMKILGFQTSGCFADYVALPQSVVWKNDKDLAHDVAAVQEPMGNAVYCTLVEPVTAKSVVVFGDGPIGLMAASVAKASGASQVILVGLDPYRLNIAREIGPDSVIDASKEDVIGRVRALTGGTGADVVLEMAGAQAAVDNGIAVVRKGGRYSAFGLHNKPVVIDYNEIIHKGIVIHAIHGRLMFDTWVKVRNLLDAGLVNIKPVITHHMPLTDFEKAFDLVLSRPTAAAKVILYPDPGLIPDK
jgi:threonine 3-dehydrogenase